MAIEPIESTNTPNEGREIINDNFVDLDGRINEINPDGLAWHFGTGAPLDAVGFDGDMYFATDTGTYYGPKAAGAWPSSGVVVSAAPDATESVKGKAEIATQTETDTGTDDTRIVTPLKLANYSGLGGGSTPAASETVPGKAEIATQTETNTGTDDARIVTPLKLASRTSTETRAGVVELATDAETQTGTDTARAITPANLSARSATETRSGIAEIATQTETDTGTDDVRIVTALKAATRYLAKAGGTLTGFLTLHADPTSALHAVTKQYADALVIGGASPASETVAGIAELATQTETDTGTDDARIVTPLKLASRTATDTRAGVVELATDAETQTGTDTARAITPANLSARTSTETRSGVVELATDAETQTGTDTARAITPANLSARSATETRSGIAEIATQTETNTGTDDTRIVTPLKLANYSGLGGGTMPAPITVYHWNSHTSVTLTNMASTLSVFYSGGNTFEVPTDLTNATEARIFVKVITAGHTTAEVRAQFATTFGGSYGYLDASAGPAVNISSTGGIKSSWVTLDAGVKADGFIRVITINGNAIADPVVAEILVQAR